MTKLEPQKNLKAKGLSFSKNLVVFLYNKKSHYALVFSESIMFLKAIYDFFSMADNSRHNKPYKNMTCLSFIDSVGHNSTFVKSGIKNHLHTMTYSPIE